MALTLVTNDLSTTCRLARRLERQGEYNKAAQQLRAFWPGLGHRPNLEGLGESEAAELLLRAGALTGWLGSLNQIPGSQDVARDLLTEAERLFGEPRKVAECRNAVAVTYWRERNLEAAAAVAWDAYEACPGGTPERVALIVILAMIEVQRGHLSAARDFLKANYEEVREVNSPHDVCNFHGQLGYVYKRLGEDATDNDERQELLDLALIEYEGAVALLEAVGSGSYAARIRNNIAMLFVAKGCPHLAHPYIQAAIAFAKGAQDKSLLGSFEETRAQILLAEGDLRGALVAIKASLAYLSGGDETGLQVDSYVTQGVIFMRMGDKECADSSFDHAISLAESGGIDTASIRLKHLKELVDFHKTEALRCEKEWVRSALDAAGGHPSHAAKLLGVSHQNCINKIRRFDLQTARTPAQPRQKRKS